MSTLDIYPSPTGAKPSADYRVEVNGKPIWVGGFAAGAHASFGLDGAVEVTIRPVKPVSQSPIVRPLNLGIEAEIHEDQAIRLHLHGPAQLYIEFADGPDLMLFANPLETDKPSREDPTVRYFAAGKVHDAGNIILESGQTLYIEGGAIVKGHVTAQGAENVSIRGHGILDGRHYPKGTHRLVEFDGCRNVQVQNFCTIGTPSWNMVFGACTDVHVSGVKLIGWVVCSDGIDILGCTNVHVENSFFRNNDDCVAIKARSFALKTDTPNPYSPEPNQHDWCSDTSNVLVERCVMFNDKAGNVLEIGYETSTESISNIVFRDIDVIGAHGEGGVFTIHNGDRARIENVRYENIRVEHFYDKLVDFRIMPSRYSQDDQRGHIRGVHLKDIQIIADRYNCISVIGGYDAEHTVEDVTFENVWVGDVHVLDADALHLFVKQASDIKFL